MLACALLLYNTRLSFPFCMEYSTLGSPVGTGNVQNEIPLMDVIIELSAR